MLHMYMCRTNDQCSHFLPQLANFHTNYATFSVNKRQGWPTLYLMTMSHWHTNQPVSSSRTEIQLGMYCQISNIRGTKSQNLNVFPLILQLFLPYPLLSREWRCSWSSADRRCSNYIWELDIFIACYGAPYIRGFTVYIYKRNPH